MGIVGGPWSTGDVLVDEPSYLLRWRDISSRAIRTSQRSWAMTVPSGGLAEETVDLEFAELGFLGKGVHAVTLAGIEWDTDIPQSDDFPSDYDPADGWTPQGFGAGVELLGVDDTGLSVRLWSHFKGGPLDREDMNEALPFARVGAKLHFVVVELIPAVQGVLTKGALAASAYYEIDPPNTPHPVIPEEQRELSIVGEADRSFAVPLLLSWDFELNASLDEEGRYLREFRAGIERFEYEATSATGSFVVDAFASLSSLIEEGDLEVDFRADLGLLQWDEPDASARVGVLEGVAEQLGPFELLVETP